MNKAVEENNVRNQYSIPGILHFIQHEWARFEMERSQWEVEKAELQARIAFLQGERKGQENLKNDLVRRIKMLEYALKQERAKYSKLKYGGDGGDVGPPPQDDDGVELPALEQSDNMIAVTNSNWRQGRQLLRQYLQEIGYTDTIIDVRSNRVRSLLGLQSEQEETNQNLALANGAETTRRVPDNRRRWEGVGNKAGTGNMAEEMLINTEESVMANFDFLAREDDLEDEDEVMAEESDDGFNPSQIVAKADLGGLGVDTDTEDVLKEFNFLTQAEPDTVDKGAEWSGGGEWGVARDGGAAGQGQGPAGPPPVDQSNLELGELEQLTINNDNDLNYDQMSTPKEAFRKTWSAKYTLRSHFDGVRSLGFHPSEPVLITASEDQTLKMWNLQKTITTKKSTNLDVEPVYTFRGHTGPVLCLCVSGAGDFCFSGGVDAVVRCWNIPPPTIDPYDTYDASVMFNVLEGHKDAVWKLSYSSTRQQLLSCSADGTVKLWSPSNTKTPLVATLGEEEEGVPTCCDWVSGEAGHLVISFSTAACIIYDAETSAVVTRLETGQDPVSGQPVGPINAVLAHPTLPLTITGHEDRHIRFYDNNTGALVHSMVAHLDSVTSLAVDQHGLYLISGSHDCSIRLWNLESKTCVQEITAHRKKFDESIFDVAFHPSRPYIASAGADALAKVFI
jgi:striatin 1/3/4